MILLPKPCSAGPPHSSGPPQEAHVAVDNFGSPVIPLPSPIFALPLQGTSCFWGRLGSDRCRSRGLSISPLRSNTRPLRRTPPLELLSLCGGAAVPAGPPLASSAEST